MCWQIYDDSDLPIPMCGCLRDINIEDMAITPLEMGLDMFCTSGFPCVFLTDFSCENQKQGKLSSMAQPQSFKTSSSWTGKSYGMMDCFEWDSVGKLGWSNDVLNGFADDEFFRFDDSFAHKRSAGFQDTSNGQFSYYCLLQGTEHCHTGFWECCKAPFSGDWSLFGRIVGTSAYVMDSGGHFSHVEFEGRLVPFLEIDSQTALVTKCGGGPGIERPEGQSEVGFLARFDGVHLYPFCKIGSYNSITGDVCETDRGVGWCTKNDPRTLQSIDYRQAYFSLAFVFLNAGLTDGFNWEYCPCSIDTCGHGTSVASVVVGQHFGVASNGNSAYSVKFQGTSCTNSYFSVIATAFYLLKDGTVAYPSIVVASISTGPADGPLSAVTMSTAVEDLS